MKFRIVLRKTEDWDKLNFKKFSSCTNHHTMRFPEWEKRYLSIVRRWEYLNINYFQYRHMLKKMVMDRWNIPWVSCEDASSIDQKDVILLPTDDDDCYHPNIANVIAESFEDTKVNLVWWKTCCHCVLNGVEKYETEIELYPGCVSSNGYAVRANVATYSLLANHTRAFETRGESVFLDEILGYRTIHLAGIQWSKTKDVLYSLGDNIKRVEEKPKGVEWAFDLMDEFYELSNGLRWQVKVL